MATYDPLQPIWKRNLAGILDFLLAFFICVYVVSKTISNLSDVTYVFSGSYVLFSLNKTSFKVGGGSALLALALIVAYFVVLGQTGGTVFQRLFRMKRVTLCH